MVRATRLALALAVTTAIAASTAATAVAAEPAVPSGSAGIVAPAETGAARALTAAENAELVALSDPSTVTDLHDGQRRMERVAEILSGAQDRRGIFAIFYRNILRDANPVLDQGNFDDPEWARAVSAEFFRIYLVNLRAHLTGGTVSPEWTRYYDLAADPSRSAGRVAAAALDAHLHIDFPEAIAATGTRADHARDFFAIGDSLIAIANNITADLDAVYGAKLADFFHAYFVGPAVDSVLGENTTSYVMFQSVRGISFANGLALGSPALRDAAAVEMRVMYDTAETVFDDLEAANLI
ncbi:DUF5995 family protein [Nocardia tengchongensis]|uniref:DUF5995 family protein n=1 Tax=Nocardia tengchongensis TaxID=2055889 RepID=UPI003650851D